MKKVFYVLLVACVCCITAIVSCNKEEAVQPAPQDVPEYSLGCQLLPIAEYEKIPLAETPVFNQKSITAILNLSTPNIGDQGGEGSCVAWGTTYAGRSIDWQTGHGGAYSTSTNIFSPEYVYNQIKVTSSCASGAYVVTGLNLLKSKGVCTWSSMPYDDKSCSTMPNANQNAEAALYKIASYKRVTVSASAIKAQLEYGKPVIVAGPVNNAFVKLANGGVLGRFSGSSLGGHCYCVVGYDDTKSAFKFMNSWGTSWATQGYGYIGYSYVKSWWQEAYVVYTN